jgi:tetratricopeptide (TPR) repeat protein
VLTAVPDDPKALFRRAQANKELNKLDEALKDARRLVSIDPKNKQFIDFIQVLTKVIQDRTTEQRSTKTQVKNMIDYASKENGENKINVSLIFFIFLLN